MAPITQHHNGFHYKLARCGARVPSGYAIPGLINDAIALRGTETCVASIAGCSEFWSKKNTIALSVIAKLW
jgi:hypothetical protein